MSEDELSILRHTLAHLLAAAVRELYPHAKPTLGPAVDDGFYYDFDFTGGDKPREQDLKKIEQKMKELLKKWTLIEGESVSEEQARDKFSSNKYKLELIDEINERGDGLSLYHSKNVNDILFTDLCRGGHIEHPKEEIPSKGFELDRIAGAYWRGDEKNAMLTRIYGLAFDSKDALVAYKQQREEARKRDHRKLGKEQDLFMFSDLVGSGLPLWTPKGTILREQLNKFVWDLRSKHGYEKVSIPHITKKNLYETSGHWEKFSDELFRITTREGKEYALKPMNCPHHTQIFARHPHSYRDMPQRYAETTTVYRDEQSGELGGLTRVLSITQDDSHVFCRHSQVKEEFNKIWDMIDTLYKKFDFKISVRLSFHDPTNMDTYLGTQEIWKNAETSIRQIAQERNADYVEAPGEAAMYGPKLDFMATDSIVREHQVATIQLDLNLPERFDLSCVNEEGDQERIVMIHSAILGSIERFTAVLIEHLAGKFPFWLAPVQVEILPIAEAHKEYASTLENSLRAAGIRAHLDATDESLGKRIRKAKLAKIPALLVVGDKEVERNQATLEKRDGTSTQYDLSALSELLREASNNRTDL